jgi:hypothetical protein
LGLNTILMWASTQTLVDQPRIVFQSDQPTRSSIRPYIGRPIIYQADIASLFAVHCVLAVDSFANLSIAIGNRYQLTLDTISVSDGLHPFVSFPRRVLRAKIEDNEQATTTAELPLIPLATVVACFGYAYNADHQLQAYAHVSSLDTQTVPQQRELGYPSPCVSCGSGSVGLLVDVDQEDAGGDCKMIVREPNQDFGPDQSAYGSVGIVFADCHIGPFYFAEPSTQETLQTKQARAGDRIASLRSNSSSFSTPLLFPFLAARNPTFPSSAAASDCAGHSELLSHGIGSPPPYRFAPSVYGQPNSDIAYVPVSKQWRSSCGFTQQQATRMSAVNVSFDNVLIYNGSGLFDAFLSATATNMVADTYGNNEYASTISQAGTASLAGEYDTVHVQVTVQGKENVYAPRHFPLSGVQVTHSFVVSVSLFLSIGGQPLDRRFVGYSATRTLNESEAIAFFNGESLAVGGATVTAVGA